MFERTVDVVHGNLLAVVPLLALCWFVGRGVSRRKGVAYRVVRKSLKLGVVPLVVLFVLAEATGRPELRRLARLLFEAEAWLVGRAVDAVDTVLAALLRWFLGLVDTLLSETFGAVAPTLPSWNPFAAVSTAGFLLSMFVVHFLAGAALVWVTRESAIASPTNGWLTAVGGVLFVSGTAWTLLQLDAFNLSRTGVNLAVVVTSVGVTTGVVAATMYLEGRFHDILDTPDRAESRTSPSPDRAEPRTPPSRGGTDDERPEARDDDRPLNST